MIGQRLAHYEVTALIGKGGMGEVYRARDTKLGRDVAVKMIGGDVASDPERLARFRREARTLAALSHPHIAPIYGIEEADGHTFLVMELVDGEDLFERLKRGALPLDDALEVAEAIAGALETAHEQGIVHRDLKPANIKLGDPVKLLDFGLARAALDGDESDPATSPTVTAAFTQAGTILGTAAYMAPEQARGKIVDRRADIWAFGVVLWEMLTGERMFAGETVSDTLASVIKDTPDLDALPPETPATVRALIARCLEKDPKRRLQSIGEARIAIESVRGDGDPSLLSTFDTASAGASDATVRRANPIPWIVAVAFAAVIGGALGLRFGGGEPPAPRLRMFDLVPQDLRVSYPRNAAMSPDGRRITYFGSEGLHIRDLQALESIAVPGTATANSPFWSPDGQWLAFGAHGQILKVAATGGQPEVVCNVDFANLDGAAWGEDGTLILAPDTGPLQRVNENGGDPVDVFPLRGSESDYHTPTFLPDGRGILYTVHNAAGRETIEVFADGERKELLRIEGARLEYAAYAPHPGGEGGALVYHRLESNPGVYTVPFDLEALEVTGEPSLLDAAGSYPSLGDDGSLLYARHAGTREGRFVVVDTTGTVVRSLGDPLSSANRFSVSPNGENLLVEADGDIWIMELERGTRRRLTYQTGVETHPAWIGDGTRFAYTEQIGGQLAQTFVGPVDGSSPPEFFVRGKALSSNASATSFVFDRFGPQSIIDIYMKSADVADTGRLYLRTPRMEQGQQLSPDGRFVTFMSDVSGRNEVYLRTFPEGDGQWQVSVGGGAWPRWSKDGSYILYRQRAGGAAKMLRTPVTLSPRVAIGAPQALFGASNRPGLVYVSGFPAYDTLPDGDLFVMIAEERSFGDARTQLVLVEDWWAAFGRE